MSMHALAAVLLFGMAPQEPGVGAKVRGTWDSAASWLVSQQQASGAWQMGAPGKKADSPSYTALILASLANAPKELKAKYADPASKAAAYLASRANPDGSFGEGPSGAFLKTYTTGLCLLALSSVERTDKVADLIRGAQAYLKKNQLREGPHAGGIGYGEDPKPGAPPPDPAKQTGNLSLLGFAADGLKASGLPQDDEFWKLAVTFVRKCQNNSEVNTDPAFVAALKAKGLSVGDDGGLYYSPLADAKASPAGTRKVADKEVIASYGAMTYDGIKTYLYAGMAKDSPEVKSAVDWVRKNYAIETHPGFAFDPEKRKHLQGLYYYYLLMARALDALGERPLLGFDGTKHDWPADLGSRLVATVKESKMWVNDNPAWYEGDPVLVTSYVLLTCDVLLKHLP